MTPVTVMLPTFNQAKLLDRALKALQEQSYKYFDVIVCDDGSTDHTQKTLTLWEAHGSLNLTCVQHDRNKGTAEAINTCARLAQGKLWTWVSSDNIMYVDWLSTLVSKLTPDVGAVYSAFRFIPDHAPHKSRVYNEPHYPEKLLESEVCYYGPSFLIQSDVWRIAGPHRGLGSHDYDHWTRVEEACFVLGQPIVFVDEVLCDYYSGPWGTVRQDASKYDAPKWRAEALRRREGYKP